jgi:hypothetical protein
MKLPLVIYFMLYSALLTAESAVETILKPYKELLEWGTYEGSDWSCFEVKPKSRYETFKTAFDLLDGISQPLIVELGTSRSFTHGGLPGCNLDNPIYWTPDHPENWDWGAGFFTRMAAISLEYLQPSIHTVDIVPNHIQRCKVMTKDVAFMIEYHIASSEDFLKNCFFQNGIDLLYLDTGDMTPIEPTAQLQLEEAKIIVERNLIANNGLILIDDVKNQTPKKFGETSNLGKSKYALAYLLENGFEVLMDEYQILLRKK